MNPGRVSVRSARGRPEEFYCFGVVVTEIPVRPTVDESPAREVSNVWVVQHWGRSATEWWQD